MDSDYSTTVLLAIKTQHFAVNSSGATKALLAWRDIYTFYPRALASAHAAENPSRWIHVQCTLQLARQ